MKLPRMYACYHDAIKTIIGVGESNKITLTQIIAHPDFGLKTEHVAVKDFNKSIRREIRRLIKIFGTVEDSTENKLIESASDVGKTLYYYWSSVESKNEVIKGEGISDDRYFARAIVFTFIEEHFREFFPPTIMENLKKDLDKARNENDVLGGIAGKMQFIPSGIDVYPIHGIDQRNPGDWDLAYEALAQEFVIEAEYDSVHGSETESVKLSPQRVQYANHKVMLLCYNHESKRVKSYEVSRLLNVNKVRRDRFKQFNFADFEREYEFEALVNVGVKDYFKSVKFGNGVSAKPEIGGAWIIKSTIQVPNHFSTDKQGQPDPFAMANFLSSFADSMEVIKPDFLRAEMKRRADNLSKIYSHEYDNVPIIRKSPHEQTGNVKKLQEIQDRNE
jgi:hypothetical protein